MTITEIEPVTRKKMRVSIDGEPAFVLSASEAEEWDLHEGDVLTPQEEEQLRERIARKAGRMAMDMLLRRDYAQEELRRALVKKGLAPQYAQMGVQYVDSYHYLDDMRFALEFLSAHMNTMSRQMAVYRLREKCVEDSVISQALEQAGWDDTAGIRREAARRYGSVDALLARGEKEIVKFCQACARKGYRWPEIRSVLQEDGQDNP
ncbi:MAG: regulatory protein RecX [Lachnospiraceae bacterium]|jgi:regulatory protein